MTPITDTAPVAATIETPTATELLRDVAFVLRLTRRVKDEMVADRRIEPRNRNRKCEGLLVA